MYSSILARSGLRVGLISSICQDIVRIFNNLVRDLNALEFEACESGAKFLTKTSTDLTYEVLVELVEETVADVSFSAAVIANAAATMEISQGSK